MIAHSEVSEALLKIDEAGRSLLNARQVLNRAHFIFEQSLRKPEDGLVLSVQRAIDDTIDQLESAIEKLSDLLPVVDRERQPQS